MLEVFRSIRHEIYPNRIYPNKESRTRLLGKIRERLITSIAAMTSPQTIRENKMSVTESLSYVDSVLRAWGNGYSFCNHQGVFIELDKKVDELLNDYLKRYRATIGRLGEDTLEDKRRILGVHLLQESKLRRNKSKTLKI